MTDKAEVSFSLTKTKNLGNYESVKIQVGLTMECENSKAEIDKTYDKLNKWVSAKLDEEDSQWENCH